MKSLFLNKLFFVPGLLVGLLCSGVLTAQNDLGKTGFSIKLYTGPQFFLQSNMAGVPMPLAGFRTSIIFNTTELELGLAYSPKFFEVKNTNPTLPYTSVFFSQHNLIPSIHIHQKIFKAKKHTLSVSMGVGFIFPVRNPTDTLMNDGTHHVNWYPTRQDAIRTGIQLEASVRYTYVFSPTTAFFIAPYFNPKLLTEYTLPDVPMGMPTYSNYVPVTNKYGFGIMLGFQFIFNLAKESPPGFFADTRFKKELN